MKRLVGIFIGSVLIIVLLISLRIPRHFTPQSWHPEKAPSLKDQFDVNQILSGIERIKIQGLGPEDIAVDSEHNIFVGLNDGRIVRSDFEGRYQEVFCRTAGRPLGLEVDGQGNLIVADAAKGLLLVDQEGKIKSLASGFEGKEFLFTNDVALSKSGRVFFTVSSANYGIAKYKVELLEHSSSGRVFSYDRKTDRLSLVSDGLFFANGVAVSEDDNYLLVAETAKYRIQKIWLSGEKKGQKQVIIDNLPGFPDGISKGSDGIFWLALASPRTPLLDGLLPFPFLRTIMVALPESVWPKAIPYSFVLGINGDGEIIYNLQDPSHHSFSPITSVEQFGEFLYFGNLASPYFGRMSLEEISESP